LENRKRKLGGDPGCYLAALGIFVFGRTEEERTIHHRGHGEHREERNRKEKEA
jgi:hypothetical protein